MFNTINKIFLLILGLFLAGAIIIAAAAFRKDSSTPVSELWRLYNSELLIVAGVLVPAYLGGIWFLLVVLVFNFRSHLEVAYVHKIKVTEPFILISLITSTVVLCISDVLAISLNFIVLLQVVAVCAYLLVFVFLLFRKLNQYIYTTLLLCMILLSLTAIIYIDSIQNGLLLIVFLFIISETNDAFAFLFGRMFGKRRILPSISPRKTLEGLLSGILFSAFAGLMYNYFILAYPFSVFIPVMILVLISVLSGDILFSIYKRRHNIKDFKAVLSGQGGMLDIYDSLLTSGLVFYVMLVCMHGF